MQISSKLTLVTTGWFDHQNNNNNHNNSELIS